ncbi:MotE family protein [Methylobacterium organophilum]|uniref:Flagellar motility protein MotE, a chaperone for MotC folding n=1 Tax=Methylobacterium organophilum TaxID=410 RepID=A0ABQ4TA32_METOR|nr:hypothetical protein [Methylobacterium organophilum]GJE28515.1 hypothetical protein LKMONMHP_3387 [Methylobacterium organophilum]
MSAPTRRPIRPLVRLAKLPARPLQLRLIDAVALAAGGLLVLKLAALLQVTSAPAPGAPLPDFARALASPRTGYEPPDPATTGSVGHGSAPEKTEEKPAEPPVYQPKVPEPVSPSEKVLLEKLSARRDALKQRSDSLDLREQLLNEAEKKLETGVADLRQSEDKMDVGGTKKLEAERVALKGIVTMYETMKPKDAARVFDRLRLDVLVPIVLAMNPRKMAEVLAVMQPEPAEKLTVALANRARGVDAPQTGQTAAGLPPNELPAIDPTANSR